MTTETALDEKTPYYCTCCGSMRVQFAVWYNPNTGVVGDDFGSWNAGDNTFCADCEENSRDANPDLTNDPSEIGNLCRFVDCSEDNYLAGRDVKGEPEKVTCPECLKRLAAGETP